MLKVSFRFYIGYKKGDRIKDVFYLLNTLKDNPGKAFNRFKAKSELPLKALKEPKQETGPYQKHFTIVIRLNKNSKDSKDVFEKITDTLIKKHRICKHLYRHPGTHVYWKMSYRKNVIVMTTVSTRQIKELRMIKKGNRDVGKYLTPKLAYELYKTLDDSIDGDGWESIE